MNRRTLLKGLAAAAVLPIVDGCGTGQSSGRSQSGATLASGSSGSSGRPALRFDQKAYTVRTKTVSTASGSKVVTYHSYEGITYVANPVDKTFQSLNVSVPVKIGNKTVDATDAPILFDINVGGYMSSSVTGTSRSGGGAPGNLPTGGVPPSGGASGVQAGSGATVGNGQMVSNADLALAAGYVVVSPGVRGRDNVTSSGKYYGKAPAAIVDLKAAVRYVRHNAGRLPGNAARIISTMIRFCDAQPSDCSKSAGRQPPHWPPRSPRHTRRCRVASLREVQGVV